MIVEPKIINMNAQKKDDLIREYVSISICGLQADGLSVEQVERSKEIRLELELTHDQILDLSAPLLFK